MDYSVAKAFTFGFEIFRCKMKLWQLQIQNTGKKTKMLHMTKLTETLTSRCGLQKVRLHDQVNEIFKIRLFHEVTVTEKRPRTSDFRLQTSDSNFDIMALLVIVHNFPRRMGTLKERTILKERVTKDIVAAIDSWWNEKIGWIICGLSRNDKTFKYKAWH